MKIYYSNQAKKFLKNLEKKDKDRILKRIKTLENSHKGSRRVKRSNLKLFRVRVGKFRVLYEVDSDFIGVVKIDKRERAYNFTL